MADPEPALSRRDFVSDAGLGITGLSALTQGHGTSQKRAARVATAMMADDFGIVGDGLVDETVKVQAFLDACEASGSRVAHFGGKRVRISGPLFARSVGVVFDGFGYGDGNDPGFYVSGSGYTALTVTGAILDFAVTVTGGGAARIAADGSFLTDSRPRVDGIAFGSPDERHPLGSSVIRFARAFKLSGCGIRHTTCWDCTFQAVSVEECGNASAYAFEVAGSATQNCSESVWTRAQVEQSAGLAIHIHPNTLSCVFNKIHSERNTGIGDAPTWRLGGACTYGAIRLHAHNPGVASGMIVGQQTVVTNLRVDEADRVRILVDATGGGVSLVEAIATLENVPTQAGRVTVSGGAIRALRIGGGWSFHDCRLSQLEVGFMTPEGEARATGCVIEAFAPESGQTQGAIALTGCDIRHASFVRDRSRLRRVRLLGGTTCVLDAPGLVAYQTIEVDAHSRLIGDVRLDHAALRLNGLIDGDLTVGAGPQSLAGPEAVVTGTASGWSYPRAADVLGPHRRGMYCKNLGIVAGDANTPTAWINDGARWRPV